MRPKLALNHSTFYRFPSSDDLLAIENGQQFSAFMRPRCFDKRKRALVSQSFARIQRIIVTTCHASPIFVECSRQRHRKSVFFVYRESMQSDFDS